MLQRTTRLPALWAATLSLGLVGPVVLTSTGCKDKHADSISRVLNRPDDFYDRDLIITGKVTNRLDPTAGLLGFAAYQVDDGTGRIWVITHAGAPAEGKEIGLKARLRRERLPGQLSLPDANIVLLDEIERRTR